MSKKKVTFSKINQIYYIPNRFENTYYFPTYNKYDILKKRKKTRINKFIKNIKHFTIIVVVLYIILD